MARGINDELSPAQERARRLIREAAARHGVDPDLLEATAYHESGLRSEATSPKGAAGIAQFMEGTAKRYGLSAQDRRDDAKAADAMARHFRDMLDKYDGDVELTLVGYNAGEGRADDLVKARRAGKQGYIPGETQKYLPEIRRQFDEIRKVTGERDPFRDPNVGARRSRMTDEEYEAPAPPVRPPEIQKAPQSLLAPAPPTPAPRSTFEQRYAPRPLAGPAQPLGPGASPAAAPAPPAAMTAQGVPVPAAPTTSRPVQAPVGGVAPPAAPLGPGEVAPQPVAQRRVVRRPVRPVASGPQGMMGLIRRLEGRPEPPGAPGMMRLARRMEASPSRPDPRAMRADFGDSAPPRPAGRLQAGPGSVFARQAEGIPTSRAPVGTPRPSPGVVEQSPDGSAINPLAAAMVPGLYDPVGISETRRPFTPQPPEPRSTAPSTLPRVGGRLGASAANPLGVQSRAFVDPTAAPTTRGSDSVIAPRPRPLAPAPRKLIPQPGDVIAPPAVREALKSDADRARDARDEYIFRTFDYNSKEEEWANRRGQLPEGSITGPPENYFGNPQSDESWSDYAGRIFSKGPTNVPVEMWKSYQAPAVDDDTRAAMKRQQDENWHNSTLGKVSRTFNNIVMAPTGAPGLVQGGDAIRKYYRENPDALSEHARVFGSSGENIVRGLMNAPGAFGTGLSANYLDSLEPRIEPNQQAPLPGSVDFIERGASMLGTSPYTIAALMAAGPLAGSVGATGLGGEMLAGAVGLGAQELLQDQPVGTPFRETFAERLARGKDAAVMGGLFPVAAKVANPFLNPFVKLGEDAIAKTGFGQKFIEPLALPSRAASGGVMFGTAYPAAAITGQPMPDTNDNLGNTIIGVIGGPELNRTRGAGHARPRAVETVEYRPPVPVVDGTPPVMFVAPDGRMGVYEAPTRPGEPANWRTIEAPVEAGNTVTLREGQFERLFPVERNAETAQIREATRQLIEEHRAGRLEAGVEQSRVQAEDAPVGVAPEVGTSRPVEQPVDDVAPTSSDAADPTIYRGPDRREQPRLFTREEFAALDDKGKEEAYFEEATARRLHELTGIPNRVAYEEARNAGTLKPVQVSIDVRGLKQGNDTIHASFGDNMLDATARILMDVAPDSAYHLKGDEYVIGADSEAEAAEIMNRVQAKLADAILEHTDVEDGSVRYFKGLEVHHATGSTLDIADAAINRAKGLTKTDATGRATTRGLVEVDSQGRVVADPAAGGRGVRAGTGERGEPTATVEPPVEAPAAKESTLDRLEREGREALRAKGYSQRSGVDPEMVVALAKIAAAKLGRAGIASVDWISEMVREFGEAIRPELRSIKAKALEILEREKANFSAAEEPAASARPAVDRGEAPVAKRAVAKVEKSTGAEYDPVALASLREAPDKASDNRAAKTGGKPVESVVAADKTADTPKHKFGTTQVNAPEPVAREVRKLAASIPDSALAGDGRETNPHVTVLYGLKTPEDVAAIRELAAGIEPFDVTVGKTSTFPPSESSDGAAVVKLDIDSPELRALHKSINDDPAIPTREQNFKYSPHMTVAYVDPARAAEFSGRADLEGTKIRVDKIYANDRDGNAIEIPLGGKIADADVFFEIAPSKSVPQSEAWHAQDQDARTKATREIVDETLPDILRHAGIDPAAVRVEHTIGGFELETNPSVRVGLRATKAIIEKLARGIGYTYRQDSVLVARPGGPDAATDFVRVRFPKGHLTAETANAFFQHAATVDPALGGGFAARNDSIVFYNVRGDDGPFSGKDPDAFYDVVKRAAESYDGADQVHVGRTDERAHVTFVENDWKEHPNGEGYRGENVEGRGVEDLDRTRAKADARHDQIAEEGKGRKERRRPAGTEAERPDGTEKAVELDPDESEPVANIRRRLGLVEPGRPTESAAERQTTRDDLVEGFVRDAGVSRDEAESVVAVVDAVAEAWGAVNNRPASDYYATRSAGTAKGEGEAAARVEFLADGRALIRAFGRKTNITGLVHEVAHIFRRDLAGSLLEAAEQWAGVKDGNWTEAAEEKFARAFERYVRRGQAPTEGLRKVFADLSTWFREIYRSVKGSPLDIEITPELQHVFDTILSPEASRADVSAEARRALEAEGGAARAGGVTELNQLPVFARDKRALPEVSGDDDVGLPAKMGFKARGTLPAKLDKLRERFPNVLRSAADWRKFYAGMGADFAPLLPLNAIEYVRHPEKLVALLRTMQLSDGSWNEQVRRADAGFKAAGRWKAAYADGRLQARHTAKIFLWGILSRKLSPFPHENAFVHASVNGIDNFIEDALNGKFDIEKYDAWSKDNSPLAGTEGAGAQNNLNDYGKYFLAKMAERVTDGPDKGKTKLAVLHDLMKDYNLSGREVRRRFHMLVDGAGVDNKVVSFALLATGRTDVLVLDRVQLNHLFAAERQFVQTGVWDGYDKDGNKKYITVNAYDGLPTGTVAKPKEVFVPPHIQSLLDRVAPPSGVLVSAENKLKTKGTNNAKLKDIRGVLDTEAAALKKANGDKDVPFEGHAAELDAILRSDADAAAKLDAIQKLADANRKPPSTLNDVARLKKAVDRENTRRADILDDLKNRARDAKKQAEFHEREAKAAAAKVVELSRDLSPEEVQDRQAKRRSIDEKRAEVQEQVRKLAEKAERTQDADSRAAVEKQLAAAQAREKKLGKQSRDLFNETNAAARAKGAETARAREKTERDAQRTQQAIEADLATKTDTKGRANNHLTPIELRSTGLWEIGSSTRGLAVYEALEDGLAAAGQKAYDAVGRGADFSLARLHWETWVARSKQEVDHGSLPFILNEADGIVDPYAGAAVEQGKYDTYKSGVRSVYLGKGQGTIFVARTSDGAAHVFEGPAYDRWQAAVKKAGDSGQFVDKESPDGKFRVSKQDAKWIHDPANAGLYDRLVREFGRGPTDRELVHIESPDGAGHAGELPDAGRVPADTGGVAEAPGTTDRIRQTAADMRASGEAEQSAAVSSLKARSKDRARSSTTTAGIDVSSVAADISDLVALGKARLKKGAATLADWSADFIDVLERHVNKDYAETVKPFLEDIYNRVTGKEPAAPAESARATQAPVPVETPATWPAKRGRIGAALKKAGANGDRLANALDLADDITAAGGTVSQSGMVRLYHRTTPEAQRAIVESGAMTGKEDQVYFSTKPDGMISEYGKSVVEVDVPLTSLNLEDVFDGEAHLTLKTGAAGKSVKVRTVPEPGSPAAEARDLAAKTARSQAAKDERARRKSTPGGDALIAILPDMTPQQKLQAIEDNARARVKDKLRRMAKGEQSNAGLDPTIIGDLITAGVAKLARKTIDFAEFSKQMIEDFGDQVTPYLRKAYTGAKDAHKKRSIDYGRQFEIDGIVDNTLDLVRRRASFDEIHGSYRHYGGQGDAFDIVMDMQKAVADGKPIDARDRRRLHDAIAPEYDRLTAQSKRRSEEFTRERAAIAAAKSKVPSEEAQSNVARFPVKETPPSDRLVVSRHGAGLLAADPSMSKDAFVAAMVKQFGKPIAWSAGQMHAAAAKRLADLTAIGSRLRGEDAPPAHPRPTAVPDAPNAGRQTRPEPKEWRKLSNQEKVDIIERELADPGLSGVGKAHRERELVKLRTKMAKETLTLEQPRDDDGKWSGGTPQEKLKAFEEKRTHIARGKLKLLAKGGQLNAFLPVDVIADFIAVGAAKLARHGYDFVEFTHDMIREFGEHLGPDMREIYDGARRKMKELEKLGVYEHEPEPDFREEGEKHWNPRTSGLPDEYRNEFNRRIVERRPEGGYPAETVEPLAAVEARARLIGPELVDEATRNWKKGDPIPPIDVILQAKSFAESLSRQADDLYQRADVGVDYDGDPLTTADKQAMLDRAAELEHASVQMIQSVIPIKTEIGRALSALRIKVNSGMSAERGIQMARRLAKRSGHNVETQGWKDLEAKIGEKAGADARATEKANALESVLRAAGIDPGRLVDKAGEPVSTAEAVRVMREVYGAKAAEKTKRTIKPFHEEVKERAHARVGAAWDRIKQKQRDLASGLVSAGPGFAADMVIDAADIVGSWLLEKSITRAEIASRLIKELGEDVRPYIDRIRAMAFRRNSELRREVRRERDIERLTEGEPERYTADEIEDMLAELEDERRADRARVRDLRRVTPDSADPRVHTNQVSEIPVGPRGAGHRASAPRGTYKAKLEAQAAAAERRLADVEWASSPEALDDLAAVGAHKLTDPDMTRERWNREMAAEYGEGYTSRRQDVIAAAAHYFHEARGLDAERELARKATAGRRDLTPEEAAKAIREYTQAKKEQTAARRDLFNALKNVQQQTIVDQFLLVRKAGILTGMKTTGRNLIGTAGFAIVQEEVARIPSAIVDSVVGVFTNQRTVTGASASAMGHAMREMATRGRREFMEIMNTGVTKEQMDALQITRELATKSKILNKYVNTVFRFMSAQDRLMKVYVISRAIEGGAKVQAHNERRNKVVTRKPDGTAMSMKERTADLIANPPENLMADAILEADYATFNSENALASAYSSGRTTLRSGGMGGRALAAGADMVIPFVKTPTNILARIIDYTPAGAAITIGDMLYQRHEEKKLGTFERTWTPARQEAFSRGIGRASTGTALLIIGAEMFKLGILSGTRDDDASKRDRDDTTGRQPMSIKFMGMWHNVGALSPFGNILALGATFQREWDQVRRDPSTVGSKLFSAAAGTVIEQPMLKGTKDIIDSSTRPATSGGRLVGGLAASVIPTFVSDFSDVMDTSRRDARTVPQSVIARTPLRPLLPDSYDLLGRQKEHLKINAINPFISKTSNADNDPVDAALEHYDVGISRPKIRVGESEETYRERYIAIGKERHTAVAELLEQPWFKEKTPDKQKEDIEDKLTAALRKVNDKFKVEKPAEP